MSNIPPNAVNPTHAYPKIPTSPALGLFVLLGFIVLSLGFTPLFTTVTFIVFVDIASFFISTLVSSFNFSFANMPTEDDCISMR